MALPSGTQPRIGASAASSPEISDAESSSPEDFVPLARTRARRSNAGSRLAGLLAQESVRQEAGLEDDLDLEKHYLQDSDGNPISDVEIEDEDAEFIDKDPEAQADEKLESSDEDEDPGPPGDGEEDLEGEKELKKQERQEKKRKAKDAGSLLPALRRKRVKLAESAKKEDGSVTTVNGTIGKAEPRQRSRAERASWLPTLGEAVRASTRTSAIRNKRDTIAKLVQGEANRRKLTEQMRKAEERKQQNKARPMTQAERLAEAERTERMNSKSLNRWEDAERRRTEEQKAKLDALKNKKMDGPFIRYYSGPAIWVDDLLRAEGPDIKIEVIQQEVSESVRKQKEAAAREAEEKQRLLEEEARKRELERQNTQSTPAPTTVPTLSTEPYGPSTSGIMFAPPQGINSFLFGIHEYASQPAAPSPPASSPHAPRPTPAFDPVRAAAASSASPAVASPQPTPTHVVYNTPPPQTVPTKPDTQAPVAPMHYRPPNAPPAASFPPPNNWATPQHRPYSQAASYPTHSARYGGPPRAPPPPCPPPQRPPSPPPPKVFMATRNTLTLVNFETEDNPVPLKDKDSVKRVLFPHWSGLKTFKPTKVPPTKCVLTLEPARYRDPKTGLAYLDNFAYKGIQRLIAGSATWSGLLEAYVGPRIGWGKPAFGVPVGFWNAEDRRRMKEQTRKALPPPATGVVDLTKDGGNVTQQHNAQHAQQQQVAQSAVGIPGPGLGMDVKREGVGA